MSEWDGYCEDCDKEVKLALSAGDGGSYHCMICGGFNIMGESDVEEPVAVGLSGIDMLHVSKIIDKTDEVLLAEIKREDVLYILDEVQKAANCGKWSVEIPTPLNEDQCWYVVRHWLPRFSVRTDIAHFGSPRGTRRIMIVSWLRIKGEKNG